MPCYKVEDGKSIASLEYYQQWFSLASKEIDQLHHDLEELELQLNSSEETLLLKDELIMLKNKVYIVLYYQNYNTDTFNIYIYI